MMPTATSTHRRRRSDRHSDDHDRSATRISRLQLGEIELQLTDQDRQLLRTLQRLRYLKTSQVERLFFSDRVRTPRAALTATTRTLHRLKNYGLISHLPKRVGGPGHGSTGLIWYLTEAGIRLINLGLEEQGKRKRILEPSPTFLRHTLAVAECYIQICEICKSEPEMRCKYLCVEPECWRAYEKNGRDLSLRPDLYTHTISGNYEDLWFIEMDLDTEALPAITEKCRRYHEYYQTNKEQHAVDVFPSVLWIVPTEQRKQSIKEMISHTFSHRLPHIFLIITPEALHQTLRNGVKEEDLC